MMAEPVIAFIILCFSLLNENQFLSNGNKVFFIRKLIEPLCLEGKFFFCHDKVYPLFVCPLLEKTNPSSVPPENHLTQQNPPSPHPCDRKMTSLLTF